LDKAGLLPDKGHLARSVATYLDATITGCSTAVVVAAAVGMIVWLVVGRWRTWALPVWVLVVVPVSFYTLSLYTGQIALRLGDSEGGSLFNLRYGLQALPGLAAMAGLLVAVVSGRAQAREAGARSPARGRQVTAVAVGAAVVVAGVVNVWQPGWQSVPVVAEGLQQRQLGAPAWAGAQWLHEHAVDEGGVILIDDSVNPMLPVIAADLDTVTAPFSGKRWERTLDDLTLADWVFVDTAGEGDAVSAAIDEDAAFHQNFQQVFSDSTVQVYHNRRAGPSLDGQRSSEDGRT
jgi:hypothetical protein